MILHLVTFSDLPERNIPGDLFLDGFRVSFRKEVQKDTAEVMRVAVRVPQLVRDGVQKQVTTCTTKYS